VKSHAFLFADLCGFTAYTHRHGDVRAAELAVAFHACVCELAEREGCEVVKSIGDAVMVRCDDAHDALRLGSRVVALGGVDGRPRVRIGIDVGPAVALSGDWYGSTVNTAARVADSALPGELIVTDRTRRALARKTDVRLQARGVRALKGLPSVRLHAAAA
jgi:class 3 adenylate cyclase